MWELLQFPAVLRYCHSDSFWCAIWHLMLGSGKDVLGVVRISWDEVGAGTFPDNLLPIPGPFHVQMACMDAINRKWPMCWSKWVVQMTHIPLPKWYCKTPKKGATISDDEQQDQECYTCSYPQSLDRECGWGSSDVEQWARDIAVSYFDTKGNPNLNDQHQNKGGDKQKRNQLLFNRDAMQYQILVHVMNHGMVDVVINALSFWILIFQACGKHKYLSYLSKFLFRLKHYPVPLQAAVLRCWLCNPSGKANGFCPVDWLVELMNLYMM